MVLRPLRTLVISTNHPSPTHPLTAPFHHYLFSELAQLCDLMVVTPVSWTSRLQPQNEVIGRIARYAPPAYPLTPSAGADRTCLRNSTGGLRLGEIPGGAAYTCFALKDDIRLLGPIPHPALTMWLNAADVLALSSRRAGSPNVVREALACGTPVVATQVGDAADWVDATSGEVVPVGDAAAMADAVGRALRSSYDRQATRACVAAASWLGTAESRAGILRNVVAEPRATRLRATALLGCARLQVPCHLFCCPHGANRLSTPSPSRPSAPA